MKKFLFFVLMSLPLFGEKPFEFPETSKERAALLELIRPEVARKANLKPEEIKFEGSVKVQGKWAFFVGKTLDKDSKDLKLEPYGKGETCALYIETKKGWKVVDWRAGYSDLIYADWGSAYRLDAAIFGLPAYLNPE